MEKWKNKLICGDNLEELTTIEKETVDLVYIDPPFFSNRQYEIIWGDEAEIKSFEDRWEGGINAYIDWMKQRVIELHRVLKPTGSFYLRCDWHASHYLKVMCDEIFRGGRFLNEIIWCYRQGGRSEDYFPRKHDTIFWYAKSQKHNFYPDSIRVRYEGTGGYQTSGFGVVNKRRVHDTCPIQKAKYQKIGGIYQPYLRCQKNGWVIQPKNPKHY
jgi:DNA modification methylase